MHTLRRFKASLLNQASDEGAVHDQLLEAGVPVTDADCRVCPNPCTDDHESYPARVDVDLETQMFGSVKPYRRQVVISTGKSDWDREVTDTAGSLAAYLLSASSTSTSKAVPPTNRRPPVQGILRESETTRISILNGSHKALSHDDDLETVLVLPDYTVVTEVPRSLSGAEDLWKSAVDPSTFRVGPSNLKTHILPFSVLILLCSHKKRDNRCAIAAPILQKQFTHSLESKGWTVETQLDEHDFGPAIETFTGTEDEKESQLREELEKLPEQKRALILMNSHIGGHKYVGNCIIYTPQGVSVWYGRVTSHEVESVVVNTIEGGKILPPLLRAGLNIDRPGKTSLHDW